MSDTFKQALKRIAESRGMSYEDVLMKWESYRYDFMMGKFITPPNLETFQEDYV